MKIRLLKKVDMHILNKESSFRMITKNAFAYCNLEEYFNYIYF
ncbi:hypothetical protein BN1221_03479c [Brenneria goodwinii]|uniref:Uncharacterized protein n=1 Tax=Brenneria goodwinii TaxID=1109412 RepID=A0A0G4JZ47_9GAMM|nr:hypothetical protein BN1221_03479c [Brenneria goodwinii]